jgi:hypothetical protein
MPLPDRVTLARRDVPPEIFLAQLHHWDREITRERQKLTHQRTELERREADLADGRALLAEQVARLGAMRDHRQENEQAFVQELEQLARSLHVRELALHARERDLERTQQQQDTERSVLERERNRLAEWSTSVTQKAEKLSLERDRELYAAREARNRLIERETALKALVDQWTAERQSEREAFQSECQTVMAKERQLNQAWLGCDRLRKELLADAARIAEQSLAVEQLTAEATRKAPRRLRILRRAWERHFERFRRDAEHRLAQLQQQIQHAESTTTEANALVERLASERIARQHSQYLLELGESAD